MRLPRPGCRQVCGYPLRPRSQSSRICCATAQKKSTRLCATRCPEKEELLSLNYHYLRSVAFLVALTFSFLNPLSAVLFGGVLSHGLSFFLRIKPRNGRRTCTSLLPIRVVTHSTLSLSSAPPGALRRVLLLAGGHRHLSPPGGSGQGHCGEGERTRGRNRAAYFEQRRG